MPSEHCQKKIALKLQEKYKLLPTSTNMFFCFYRVSFGRCPTCLSAQACIDGHDCQGKESHPEHEENSFTKNKKCPALCECRLFTDKTLLVKK